MKLPVLPRYCECKNDECPIIIQESPVICKARAEIAAGKGQLRKFLIEKTKQALRSTQ